MRGPAPDRGSATVEFVGLSVIVLLPLVYLLVTVFEVQRAAFAVTQAAREAGRAYATAASSSAGLTRARYATDIALADQGVPGRAELGFVPAGADCDGARSPGAARLRPGERFVVCVRTVAPLPFTGAGLPGGGVTVTGRFTVAVDTFRAARP